MAIIEQRSRASGVRHRGTGMIAGVEMWERFSFYGMQAILVYYLYQRATDGGLGMDRQDATALIGMYGALIYLCTFLGGWVADRILGAERTLLGGAVALITGHLLLSTVPGYPGLVLGLLPIALGSGFLKTAAITVLGRIHLGDDRGRDIAFQIFYLGINVGAVLGPLLTGWLAARHGYHAGFAAAAGLMLTGILAYLLQRRRVLPDLDPETREVLARPANPAPRRERIAPVVGVLAAAALVTAAVASGMLGLGQLSYVFLATTVAVAVWLLIQMLTSPKVSAAEKRRVIAFLPLLLASTAYWTLQAQIYGVLAVYSELRLDRMLGGVEIPAAWLQALNPLFILIFAVPVARLWNSLGDRRPAEGVRMGGGVILAGFGMLILLPFAGGGAASTPVLVLAATVLVITLGELLIGPVGMAATSSYAPRAFATRFSALYFLTMAVGASLAGALSTGYDPGSESAERSYILLVSGGAVAVGILVLLLTRVLGRGAPAPTGAERDPAPVGA